MEKAEKEKEAEKEEECPEERKVGGGSCGWGWRISGGEHRIRLRMR